MTIVLCIIGLILGLGIQQTGVPLVGGGLIILSVGSLLVTIF